MTLPDGNEAREHAASGADEAPGVAQALAMHREQVDKAEASADEREMAADRGRKEPPGTALAEADPLQADPFLTKAPPAPELAAAKSWKSLLLDYSAHAAMIVGLIGFAWTVSDHVVTHQTAAQIEAPTTVAAASSTQGTDQAAAPKPAEKRDEVADLRSANERMARDVDALRAELGTLQTALRQDRSPDQLRALAADLDGVKAGLNAVKGETTTAIASLSGRLDKSQRDTNAKVQQLAAASAPLEHQGVDTAATGSITPETKLAEAKPVQSQPVQSQPVPSQPVQTRPSLPVQSHELPVPVARPAAPTRLAGAEGLGEEGRRAASEKAADEAALRPAVLPGWVVREVYQGVALIEGRRGELEVVPGVSIPGAGIVKSIDRRGNGWTVTTTKGLLAYAAPQRDYRRPNRDYYPGSRDDF